MGEARIDLKTGISHLLCLALDDPEVMPSLILATDAIRRHNAIPCNRDSSSRRPGESGILRRTNLGAQRRPGHLGKDYTALDEKR